MEKTGKSAHTPAGGDGHLLSERTLQFVLLLMGFLELSEDGVEEVFKAGQQVRLILPQLKPQLPDVTFTVRQRDISGERVSDALRENMGVPDRGVDSWKHDPNLP